MTALFKKLNRYVISCHVCRKTSGCLVSTKEEAALYFMGKGWSTFERIAKDGKESIVSSCKNCGPILRAMVKPAENAVPEEKN